jgi:hypothetical protein
VVVFCTSKPQKEKRKNIRFRVGWWWPSPLVRSFVSIVRVPQYLLGSLRPLSFFLFPLQRYYILREIDKSQPTNNCCCWWSPTSSSAQGGVTSATVKNKIKKLTNKFYRKKKKRPCGGGGNTVARDSYLTNVSIRNSAVGAAAAIAASCRPIAKVTARLSSASRVYQ